MTGKNRNYTIEELEDLIEGRVRRRGKLDKNLDKAVDDLIGVIKNPKMKKKKPKSGRRATVSSGCGNSGSGCGYTVTYTSCGGGGRC